MTLTKKIILLVLMPSCKEELQLENLNDGIVGGQVHRLVQMFFQDPKMGEGGPLYILPHPESELNIDKFVVTVNFYFEI